MDTGELVREFDEEMAITRRLLERVPSEQGAWKPHPKSFPLGHLAQLVATMPGWITQMLEESKLDLGAAPPYRLQSTEDLLRQFDELVAGARAAIAATTAEQLAGPWSLTHGETVLFTAPRAGVLRQTVNHLVHHRGQLTVYLRLLDVPLPSIYGPTADTPWQPAT